MGQAEIIQVMNNSSIEFTSVDIQNQANMSQSATASALLRLTNSGEVIRRKLPGKGRVFYAYRINEEY